jgi:hypothetical protein
MEGIILILSIALFIGFLVSISRDAKHYDPTATSPPGPLKPTTPGDWLVVICVIILLFGGLVVFALLRR